MIRKGTKVKITSLDNDSYIGWFDRELIVTHASNKDSTFYDMACYPEKLCELKYNPVMVLQLFAL